MRGGFREVNWRGAFSPPSPQTRGVVSHIFDREIKTRRGEGGGKCRKNIEPEVRATINTRRWRGGHKRGKKREKKKPSP